MPKLDKMSPNEYTVNLIDRLRKMGIGTVFDSLNQIPFCFSGDGLAVFGRNLGFFKDDRFMNAFKNAVSRYEVPEIVPILESIVWKKHIICSLASQALSIEGDFVECGVEWGFGIDVVTQYTEFSNINKKWYLYDTFNGVPAESRDEGFKVSELITKKSQFKQVKAKFSHLNNVILIQGMLPESLKIKSPEKIAFLHIDLNNVIGEIAVFTKLYPKLSIGGMILFDDYGSLLFAKQHIIEKDYFSRLGLRFTELPTGQAFLVKTKEVNFGSDSSDLFEKYNFEKYLECARPYCKFTDDDTDYKNNIVEEFDYLQNQLNYISRFADSCGDQKLSDRLKRIHQEYQSYEILLEDGVIKYRSVIDLVLKKPNEIMIDLKTKINFLQSVIDHECK